LPAHAFFGKFKRAEIQYASGDSVGVRYRVKGIQSTGQAEAGMQLIADYCGGGYKVTSRSQDDGWMVVDAECK
jgi:hypothetical protein